MEKLKRSLEKKVDEGNNQQHWRRSAEMVQQVINAQKSKKKV